MLKRCDQSIIYFFHIVQSIPKRQKFLIAREQRSLFLASRKVFPNFVPIPALSPISFFSKLTFLHGSFVIAIDLFVDLRVLTLVSSFHEALHSFAIRQKRDHLGCDSSATWMHLTGSIGEICLPFSFNWKSSLHSLLHFTINFAHTFTMVTPVLFVLPLVSFNEIYYHYFLPWPELVHPALTTVKYKSNTQIRISYLTCQTSVSHL